MNEMYKDIIIIIRSNKNKRPVFKQLTSGKSNLQNSLVYSWSISSSPKGTIESSIPKIHHASPVVNPRCVSPHEEPECRCEWLRGGPFTSKEAFPKVQSESQVQLLVTEVVI